MVFGRKIEEKLSRNGIRKENCRKIFQKKFSSEKLKKNCQGKVFDRKIEDELSRNEFQKKDCRKIFKKKLSKQNFPNSPSISLLVKA